MSSLADFPELVGFFSYSRKDDEHSQGALSRLRTRIHSELRLQLGRDVRLWQDTAAIPDGALWADEIKRAIAESVFFIPIVTPSAVASPHCRHEFEAFLERERALGRRNLVFPLLYIRVPELEVEERRRGQELLELICARQYVDWQKLRHRDWASSDVAERIEQFCQNIVDALRQPWTSPDPHHRIENDTQSTADGRERALAPPADAAFGEGAEDGARRLKARPPDQPRPPNPDQVRTPPRRTLVFGALIGAVALAAIGLWLFTMSRPVDVASPPATEPTLANVVPLTSARERTLKPKDAFNECATCPEMVVVPAGQFSMGSPSSEQRREPNEGPPHTVAIAKPFAVGKFAVTREQFEAFINATKHPLANACDTLSGTEWKTTEGKSFRDPGFTQTDIHPVVCVNWNDANSYATWLSKATGKEYWLLSESRREYVMRAGSQTAYPWGDEIGKGNANCSGCGSEWDNRQTAPVGSFPANAFGLYDTAGNVFEWVEDCYHENYVGAPSDGSPWTTGDCSHGVIRGGSWDYPPPTLRSAYRLGFAASIRGAYLGFRVGRTLAP